MNNKEIFPDLIKNYIPPKQNFFISIDTYDENNCAFCLTREINNDIIIILLKSGFNKTDFEEIINNLTKYFNATIIKEV